MKEYKNVNKRADHACLKNVLSTIIYTAKIINFNDVRKKREGEIK